MDLLSNFGISCTFNVENLVSYRCTFDTDSDPFVDEPTPNLLFESLPLPPLSPKLSYATENIDSILDNQIVSTRDGGTRRYIIKWKGRSDSENSWITEDFDSLIPTYWSISTAGSSFPPHTRQFEFFPLRGN